MAAVTRPHIPHTYSGKRLLLVSGAVGVAGLVMWAIGLTVDIQQAMFSYLAAFAFAVSVVLGVLVFTMIGHAMGARWVAITRRLEEAVTGTLPLLALLFVPIAVGATYLYVWVEPGPHIDEHLAHLLEHKAPYLNLTFFVVRTAIFFGIWILIAELLRRWSRARERHLMRARNQGQAPPKPTPELSRDRALSAALLPLVSICLTFAAFDWIMSLEPAWFSTIFGIYYFAGGFLGGLALLTILGYAARRSHLLGEQELTRYHFHALGRLLFAFVVFWAYVAFFQAMLIKIANKPEEVVFYVHRIAGSWEGLVYALIIGHFTVPFLVLLPRSIKFRPAVLSAIAGWLLVIHYIDIYWLVLPVLHPHGAAPHWLDLAALAGVVGVTVGFGSWRLRGTSLLAEGDPRLAHAIAYRSAPG